MHSARKLIVGIIDLFLVGDACVSIYSGEATGLDYIVLLISLLVLLLSIMHYKIRK